MGGQIAKILDNPNEKEIKKLFDKFDRDHSNLIDRSEFENVSDEFCKIEFKRLNIEMKEREVKEWRDFLFQDVDTDNSGEISFEEFLSFIKERRIKFKIDFDHAHKTNNIDEVVKLIPNIRYIPDINKALLMLISDKSSMYLIKPISLLLEKKAEVHSNLNYEDPLFISITKKENIEYSKLFLKYKADPNKHSYLSESCVSGNIEKVKLLLENKANVNKDILQKMNWKKEKAFEIINLLINNTDIDTSGYLFRAIESKNESFILSFIQKEKNVNQLNSNGESTLHFLVKEDLSNKLIECLLEKKANVDLVDSNNEKPINKVNLKNIEKGTELLTLLLKYGSDPNSKIKGTSLLEFSVKNKNNPLFKTLTEKNVNIFSTNFPLLPIFKYMVEIGVGDTKQKDPNGNTFLLLLCKEKQLDVKLIEKIVENGHDINAKDNKGKTPLYYLLSNDTTMVDLVKFFVEKKADLNVTTNNNEGLLHPLLSSNIQSEILSYLLEQKEINFDSVTNEGKSPLHILTLNPYASFQTLQLLLQKKNFDPNLKDNQGNSPTHYICQNPKIDFEILSLFKSHNSNFNLLNDENNDPVHFLLYNKNKFTKNYTTFVLENVGLEYVIGFKDFVFLVENTDVEFSLLQNISQTKKSLEIYLEGIQKTIEAIHLMKGVGIYENINEAGKIFKIASKKGSKLALSLLYKNGNIFSYQENDEKSHEYGIQALKVSRKINNEQFLSYSLWNIATHFQYGEGVEKDVNKAKDFYEESIKIYDKNALSRVNIFVLFESGVCVNTDVDKGIEFLKESEFMGYSVASQFLGIWYEKEENMEKAKYHYEKGAQLGNIVCLHNLACIYFNGDFVVTDLKKAKEYWTKASSVGHLQSIEKMKEFFKVEIRPLYL